MTTVRESAVSRLSTIQRLPIPPPDYFHFLNLLVILVIVTLLPIWKPNANINIIKHTYTITIPTILF